MHARTLTHTLPVPFKIDISTTTVQSTSQTKILANWIHAEIPRKGVPFL